MVTGATIINYLTSACGFTNVAIDRVNCEVDIFILKFPCVTSQMFLINVYKKAWFLKGKYIY